MSVPLDLVAWLVQERYIISLFYAIRQNWLLTADKLYHKFYTLLVKTTIIWRRVCCLENLNIYNLLKELFLTI